MAKQEGACKEHDRDIRLSRAQTSAVSEHTNKTGHYPVWDEVKFIARDPHWYSRRVKESIHIRLHSDNINRISGIAIPEAWMPTLRQHDNRPLPQRTAAGSVSSPHNANNALDRNPPTMSEVCDTPITNNHGGTYKKFDSVNLQYRLTKTCSERSNRRDQYESDNRETNDKTNPFIIVFVSHLQLTMNQLFILNEYQMHAYSPCKTESYLEDTFTLEKYVKSSLVSSSGIKMSCSFKIFSPG